MAEKKKAEGSSKIVPLDESDIKILQSYVSLAGRPKGGAVGARTALLAGRTATRPSDLAAVPAAPARVAGARAVLCADQASGEGDLGRDEEGPHAHR